LFFLATFYAAAGIAQPISQPPYERILVPISIVEPIPGAYGSMWVTELKGRNNSNQGAVVTTVPEGLCTLCPQMPAHKNFDFRQFVPNPNAGVYVYVGAPAAGKVSFSLRIQDISRQAQTWGTDIPVVREQQVYKGTLHLLDVPVDSRFRSALRVYDFDTPSDESLRAVRVRIYDMCGIGPIDGRCSDSPLVDTVLTLTVSGAQSSAIFPDHPAAAMIGSLVDAFPQLASIPPTALAGGKLRPATARIEIDPVTPEIRFWAFVSSTNNETQHVTAITPR
jgi:hypothetical protein